jgi:dihydroneopterin aldolase
MKADQIFIRNLVVQTIIGILPHERVNAQPIELDIVLTTDIADAAQSENITDALDYATISFGLTQYIEASKFQLIEALAEAIVKWLWQYSRAVDQIDLELRKPMAVLNANAVGLKISRVR